MVNFDIIDKIKDHEKVFGILALGLVISVLDFQKVRGTAITDIINKNGTQHQPII